VTSVTHLFIVLTVLQCARNVETQSEPTVSAAVTESDHSSSFSEYNLMHTLTVLAHKAFMMK